MRCWWCGVEPDGYVDVMTMESAQPLRREAWWSPGDHDHAEQAPSPEQLEQAGHEALMRIHSVAA